MFGSTLSTSTPAVQLVVVLNKVQALISDGMFYGTSRVLTSMAMHHLDLDFATIYRGYADGGAQMQSMRLERAWYHMHRWLSSKSSRSG